MGLLRSLIFVPGNRANMLERALDFRADVVMVDLEDSVPPGEKSAALAVAREWAPKLAQAGKRVMVRVNSLDTGLTRGELESLISPDLSPGLAGISIGKSQTVRDLQDVDHIITTLEGAAGLPSGQIALIPWIENARAVLTALDLASCSPRIEAIAFGAEDYTDDMGVQRTDAGEELEFARAAVAVAARAAGIGALDTPYVQFRDDEGLRRDLQISRRHGFTGRFAIHPAQIPAINEAFAPAPEEVAYATRVMEAWEQAQSQGRGSLSLDGRMVDVPVVKRAQNLLAVAEQVRLAGS